MRGTAAEFGHLVEPAIVAKCGMTHNEAMFVSPDCPALAATPDGVSLVSGAVAAVCEVKAPTCPWEAQEKGEIIQQGSFPDTAEGRKWQTQLQGQMWICGTTRGVFAVKSPVSSGIWMQAFEYSQDPSWIPSSRRCWRRGGIWRRRWSSLVWSSGLPRGCCSDGGKAREVAGRLHNP